MINFTKMHGLGNDFVVIDAINQAVNLSPEQIRFMAGRHFGVGFEQLLLVEKAVSPVRYASRTFSGEVFHPKHIEKGM